MYFMGTNNKKKQGHKITSAGIGTWRCNFSSLLGNIGPIGLVFSEYCPINNFI